MVEHPSLFLSLGKLAKKEYGRSLGQVTSFAVSPDGLMESVYVRQDDGRFAKIPADNFRIEGSEIVLISQTKAKAANLIDQIPLVWRKNKPRKSARK